MSQVKEVIVQGLWKNNSALVQLLGMCPLLAVTSTATNALGLGLATTLVLTLTNLSISALRRWTPSEIRIPIYVMIIASVVSIVQMLINAYAFGLYQSLGIFIPLIVVNCIILARAEAFAFKNGVIASAFDGIGMGLGFTLALTLLGAVREFLGRGSLLGFQIIPESAYQAGYVNNGMMTMPAMALILLGCIIWVHRAYFYKEEKK